MLCHKSSDGLFLFSISPKFLRKGPFFPQNPIFIFLFLGKKCYLSKNWA